MKRTNLLTLLILIGLVGGALFGQFVLFNPNAAEGIGEGHWTKQLGDLILIRPLTLMVIPLVLVSVVVGVTRIGDPSRLGLVGGSTVLYYLSTMLIAVTIGAILVTSVRPGDRLSPEAAAELKAEGELAYQADESLRGKIESAEGVTLGDAWMNILRQMIPTNIVEEMSATRPLGVIVFALVLGLALAHGGDLTAPAVRGFDALFEALMTLVHWVIWLTPLGVFLLAAWTVGKIGLAELVSPLALYMLCVLVGLAIHAFIVLPAIGLLFTRRNPFVFMWQMRRALMTAFGTDSSSATLPVTIDAAENEGGCSKRAANFVLPLGATVNMDGTALYEAVAVVFLFQLYGVDLTIVELLIVIITATLAAVGAAGIPSAGLVTMVIVITAVNTSVAAQTQGVQALPLAAIGVIIGVDRILDMCRTTVNVWGDSIGAKIITCIAPDEDVGHAETSKRRNVETA
jgi:solute carrier family 1 (high affinity glutamate transporter) protein 1